VVLVLLLLVCAIAPLGPSDCIVVRVVVRERTEGAGDEKVLSPASAVRLVPAIVDGRCEGAAIEREVSSVKTVGAIDRSPLVGGGISSIDTLTEPSRPEDVRLDDIPLRPVETE